MPGFAHDSGGVGVTLGTIGVSGDGTGGTVLAHTMHEGFDFGGHAFEYRDIEA
jgi:hypothetical protein